MEKKRELSKFYDHKLCKEEFHDLFELQQKYYQDLKNIEADNVFSIILPPPNITGILHLGHAWNDSIQDFLIRYNFLNNRHVYWAKGKDHAGIATQVKYLKYVKENKIDISSLTNEQKINETYKWALNNSNHIEAQFKTMGLFLDYEKEHFTLDETSKQTVLKAFEKLVENDLLYKDYTLVNWDCLLQTAISDIEVIKKETQNTLYYVKYFFANSKEFLTIATTRPETIFVDSCVFVNPKDLKYKKYIGKHVLNPLTGALLEIKASEKVEKDFGTGVLKCTPAHDFLDFDLAKEFNLSYESCLDLNGLTNEKAVGFEGLNVKTARKKVVAYLREKDYIVKEEEISSWVGYSERTETVVEPMLSKQWFIRMKKVAKLIIQDQQDNKNNVQFIPNKFNKTVINWLENIEDWCISRQLWWGHTIPVATLKDDENKVVLTKSISESNKNDYIYEKDVLDTWFSSGLWPIITAQNKTFDLYPSSVLVTGYDIIFFWIARMMFFSKLFGLEKPFEKVYITGLLRDEHNRKMSKSLGNGIDPDWFIEEYGADVLRLFTISSSISGEDLIYQPKKIEWYKSFLNKIWNCFKYLDQKQTNLQNLNLPNKNLNLFDYWILDKLNKAKRKYFNFVDKYDFNLAIKYLIEFIWDDFCNIYIELNKQKKQKQEISILVMNFVFRQILILLHPLAPFITNFLYKNFKFKQKTSIFYEKFDKSEFQIDENLNFVNEILEIISKIKSFLIENKKSNKTKFFIFYKKHEQIFKDLSYLVESASLNLSQIRSEDQYKLLFNSQNFAIYLDPKEIENNNKNIESQIEKLKFEIARSKNILANKAFIEKANPKKIQLEKTKLANYEKQLNEIIDKKD